MSALFDTDAIRQSNPPEAVLKRLGVSCVRKGHKLYSDCPDCGKARKFDYNLTKDVFFCFSCGFGRDCHGVIDLVMAVNGLGFIDACKYLGNAKTLTPSERAAATARRRQRDLDAQKAEKNKLRRTKKQMQDILGGCQPGANTPAETYLRTRGHSQGLLALGWADDIVFHPGLEAYAGVGEERVCVGTFPVMISKGRTSKNKLVVLHRTYIQPDGLGGFVKAAPDMDEALKLRWNPKQIVGVLNRCDRGVYLGATTGVTDDPSLPVIVAEGVESAYAMATAGIKGAFYAALNLDRIVGRRADDVRPARGWMPPKEGRAIIIACDNDLKAVPPKYPCGLERAQTLFTRAKERLSDEGFDVATWYPPAGCDPEDALWAVPEMPPENTDAKTTAPKESECA